MAALASYWLRHFWLLLWNRWTEFNKTWQEARSQRPLPCLCFSSRSGNKMAALASDWLRHFRLLLWNPRTEFNETWQEARSQGPLPSLCFSSRSAKQDGRPGLWLAETFLTSPLKPLNGIQQNLTGSKFSTSSTMFVFFEPIGKTRLPPWPLIGWDIFDFSSETVERNSTKLDRKQDLNNLYQVCVFWADQKNKMAALTSDCLRHFRLLLWNPWTEFNETWQEERDLNGLYRVLCFFGPIGKTRWPPWPLIGWDIFDFSSETPEQNSTKLDRKQDLNVLYQVCVFRADRKNKMAALTSDWLRHFQLLLWNRWTEFNETWQEVRAKRPLPSLCFSGRSEKQDGCPGLWLAETFSSFPLKPLNGIQRNLIGSKIRLSTVPTFLFWSYFFLLFYFDPTFSYFFLQILLLFLLFHKNVKKKCLCVLIKWSKIEI